MLILQRKVKETIVITTPSGTITITVTKTGRNTRLGIEAPADCKVLRGELPPRPAAATADDAA